MGSIKKILTHFPERSNICPLDNEPPVRSKMGVEIPPEYGKFAGNVEYLRCI